MGEKVKSKKSWVLEVFIVLGFALIGVQLFTNITDVDKKDERIFIEKKILIDTSGKAPDSKSYEDETDSVWEDTEFMQ